MMTENRMRLVTIPEACKYARCAKSKLYQLIGEGKIVAVKDGHATLIDLNSIDAYHASLPRIEPRQVRPDFSESRI
jgi:excisionase family DNA binding protein